MRSVRALVAAGAGLAAFAACTTFSTDPASNDGGVDAAIGADGTVDAGDPPSRLDASALPCPNADCGTVVAKGQLHASEIDVDKGLVAWTIDEPNGFLRTAPRDGKGAARNLSGPDALPRSLQFFGDAYLYLATGAAVHAVDRNDGGLVQALPSGGAGGAGEVFAQRRVGGILAVTRNNGIETCDVPAQAAGCTAVTKAALDLGGPGLELRSTPADTMIWARTAAALFGLTVTPFAKSRTWNVAATALAVDAATVYFVRQGMNAIYANDQRLQDAAAAKTLVTTSGPPTALTLGGDFVYYGVASEGIVARVPKAGGLPIVLASGLPQPTAIAAQDKLLFVALGDGRIVSVPTGDP